MTGDGVKELVVVTTRGVQVNKKQNEFPKWDKYSLTSCYWHQSRCLSRDVFSMVLIFQVLQADLGSVKKVTIERLRSLVAAISWKKISVRTGVTNSTLLCVNMKWIELLVCIYEIPRELVFIEGISGHSGWSSLFGSLHVLQQGTFKQMFW